MNPSPHTSDSLAMTELRAKFNGQLITPTDPSYDFSRTTFYGGFDQRPAAIVRPEGVPDVARVVTFARQAGLELAVRGGGHSNAGFSTTEGGLLLDLKAMRALDIDLKHGSAWAETGLTAGEYTAAAAAHNRATGFGDTASVGIGGLTLGGGVGYLTRKHGLTIDHLLAAEIVTADGQALHLDADTNPDLFWAIRGGGGNFGVVTSLEFRLHELNGIVGGMLILPATPETVTGFIEAAEAAPDELSTIANVMPAVPMPFIPPEQHGRLVIMAFLAYAGPEEAGQHALAPFRSLAKPIVDMLRPMSYPEMFPPEDGSYHPMAVSRTLFLDRVDRQSAQTIIAALQASDASLRAVQLRVLGGAMDRVPVEATAFAHRHSRIMANVAAFYTSPQEKPRRTTWVNELAAAIQQSDTGAYVNFIGEEGIASPEMLRLAYPPPTLERLAAIKARYDPTNFFHRNHNIPPAA